MARMSNMVMKPVSWVKKHWVKVLVAIVVIYAIYYFFIEEDDMEGYTTENVYSSYEIQKMKNDWLKAKADYEAAVRDYNDPTKATYVNRDGVKSDGTALGNGDLCYKATSTTSSYFTQTGCIGFMDNAKKTMDDAWEKYAPYAPKQKRSKKARRASRVRRFFGLK